jgi:hypothetical protein
MTKRTICIIALGDIGHCPRMQNHATMFAETMPNYNIKLIGYGGSDVSEAVKKAPNIQVKRLCAFPRIPIFIIYAILRIIFDSLQLFFTLYSLGIQT